MGTKTIIAIDGPAGSGKSTVARLVAKRLKLLYVDTGAMYRALTLKAIRERVGLEDGAALAKLARSTRIDLKEEGGDLRVFLDGEDVSRPIRDLELTKKVKFVARLPAVRAEMVKLQRKIANRSGAVLEGRDIGTVVFPGARRKFYLDAEFSERARRRFKELKEKGQEGVALAEVEDDVSARDKSDMTRAVGPLKKAHDAVSIDTTNLSIEEVVERILARV
jgi:cytidylate kinase